MITLRSVTRTAILGSQAVAATGVYTVCSLGACASVVAKNVRNKEYTKAAINTVAAAPVAVIMGLASGIAFAKVNRG